MYTNTYYQHNENPIWSRLSNGLQLLQAWLVCHFATFGQFLYSIQPTKSIDMLNKNTLGVKKARPSRKHQSPYMRLKGVISGRGQGFLKFSHLIRKYAVVVNQTEINLNELTFYVQQVKIKYHKHNQLVTWPPFW